MIPIVIVTSVLFSITPLTSCHLLDYDLFAIKRFVQKKKKMK